MKKVLIILFLFVSVLSFAQFKVGLSGGYEVDLNLKEKTRLYHPVFALETQYGIYEGIIASVGGKLITGDSLPDAYGVAKIGYPVWTSDNLKNSLTLFAVYSQATKGDRRYGGEAEYNISDRVAVKLGAGQIYKNKQVYGEGTLTYFFMK